MVWETAQLKEKPNPRRWPARYSHRAYASAVEKAMTYKQNPKPMRILKTDLWEESGRGIGVLSEMPASAEIYGTDIARSTCCAAHRRNGHRVVVTQCDIRALPFRDGAFDMVIDLSTIDHVSPDDALKVLGEYARVIRYSGTLLLVFWRDTLLSRFALRHIRSNLYKLNENQFLLSEKVVKRKLAPCFDIVEEYYTGCPMIPGALATRYPTASRWLDRVLPR